jgi:hypothetical protein
MTAFTDDYKNERPAVLSLLKREPGLTAEQIGDRLQTECWIIVQVLRQLYYENLIDFRAGTFYCSGEENDVRSP